MLKNLLLIALLLVPATAPLSAQQGNNRTSLFRLLPLGVEPSMKTQKKNGFMQELPAPEGSLPPRILTVVPQADGAEPFQIQVNLRRMGIYKEVPRGAALKLYEGAEANGEVWKDIKGLSGTTTLALIRDPSVKKRHWNQTKLFAFKDSLASFPNEAVRYINLSRADVVVQVIDTGKSYAVKPGQTRILSAVEGLKIGEGTTVKYGVKLGGKWKVVAQNAVQVRRGHRVSVYFFENDAADHKGVIRNKLDYVTLPEPTRDR